MTHDEIQALRQRFAKLIERTMDSTPWDHDTMLEIVGEAFGAAKMLPKLLDEIVRYHDENARLRERVAELEAALFEIRDYCAELYDGDNAERTAYRVVAMANGAINSVLAACAKREE